MFFSQKKKNMQSELVAEFYVRKVIDPGRTRSLEHGIIEISVWLILPAWTVFTQHSCIIFLFMITEREVS